jgi:hypothetical protein
MRTAITKRVAQLGQSSAPRVAVAADQLGCSRSLQFQRVLDMKNSVHFSRRIPTYLGALRAFDASTSTTRR